MAITHDERDAMRHALALAGGGPRGLNPQVGAVVLAANGSWLAEGAHLGAGSPHAEVAALSQLPPGAARGATVVVTLEPCNHTGRTGPCVDALIEAGVTRVVYAVADPNEVSSGGARRLRAAGVQVVRGPYAAEVTDLLDSWLTVQRLGRPHVTVKWAQSLDGRAAAADGTSKWITGPEARADVHRRRARADAIVVGIGTVLADDPALTAREPTGDPWRTQPRPVVLGRRAVPHDAAIRRHPLPFVQYDGRDLHAMLAELREAGVHTVFVEGGPIVASAFLRAQLCDEVLAYVAPTLLGGPRTALDDIGADTIDAQVHLDVRHTQKLGDDLLVVATPRFRAEAAAVRPVTSSASRDNVIAFPTTAHVRTEKET